MSNKDTNVATSQAAAAAVFLAEIVSAAQNGNADLCRHYAAWAGQNTGNKLYKNA